MRCFRVMTRQGVVAEVATGFAPDRVNVIRAVLRVVVLDEDRRPVKAIVMTLAATIATSPRKVQFLDPRGLDLLHLGVGDRGGRVVHIRSNEPQEHLSLRGVHRRSG